MFIVFVTFFSAIYFYIDGVPTVTNFIVNRLPLSIDKEMGQEVTKIITQKAPINEAKTILLNEFFKELKFDAKTKLYVINENQFNAFALPDNSIVIFSNVIETVNSYPELAALLAHEYAHIKYRHGVKNIAHSLTRELLTKILTGENNGDNFIKNSNKLLTLKNSRSFENKADEEGLNLMASQHIDLNGMTKLFETMSLLSDNETPAYLSTHPNIEERLKKTQENITSTNNNFSNNVRLEFIFNELKTNK